MWWAATLTQGAWYVSTPRVVGSRNTQDSYEFCDGDVVCNVTSSFTVCRSPTSPRPTAAKHTRARGWFGSALTQLLWAATGGYTENNEIHIALFQAKTTGPFVLRGTLELVAKGSPVNALVQTSVKDTSGNVGGHGGGERDRGSLSAAGEWEASGEVFSGSSLQAPGKAGVEKELLMKGEGINWDCLGSVHSQLQPVEAAEI